MVASRSRSRRRPGPSAATVPVLVVVLLVPVLSACIAGPSGSGGPAGPADLVLLDGVVWTGRGGDAEAVAVRDGEVAAVGTTDEVRAHVGDGTRVVDLEGAFVAPGFSDAHTHALEGALDPDVPGDGSIYEPTWRPYEDETGPPGSTVNFAGQVGVGVYDRLARALGVEDRAPRSYDSCSPAGEVTEEMRQRVLAADAELASQGLTTVVEAQLRNLTHLAVLRDLAEDDALDVRWRIRVVPGCLRYLDESDLGGSPDDKVRVFGVKLYADGYLGSRVAALREPYADRPGWRGMLYYDEDSFREDLEQAREANLSVGTHAIGDRATDFVLARYEEADVRASDRWTIEHAQVLDEALMGRMASLDVIASYQLSFHTADMDFAEDRLGEERMEGAYAWRSILAEGVPMAGGSDWPIEVITPLWGIARTVTRQELDGSPPGGWLPDERLSLDQTLRSITRGAHHATGEEDRRGTISPGMAADLVVVREDLSSVDPLTIANATISMTVIDGEVAFEGAKSYPPPVDPGDGSIELSPGRPVTAHASAGASG